ncbi:phage tail protein [Enterococcus sp.]|uniref:phage tail protein n=1 Tax=Enterococcus sp. TaxID=35783 RepID=UPI003C753EE8
MYVRDLNGEEYPLMATYTINDEINGNMDMSIEVLPVKVNQPFLADVDKLWEIVTDSDETYKVIYTKSQGSGQTAIKTLRAIPKLYDDMERTRVYEKYDGSMAIEDLLRIVFAPLDYTFRLVGAWTNIEIEGFGDGDTCLAMFQRVLSRIGAEFTFTGQSVTIREQIGTDSEVMYRHRLNASNIVQEVDAQNYYTYARGFGNFPESEPENAKLKRTYTSPLISLLGRREAPPIKDGRITNSATMDKALKKLVDESIKISVSADLVDLRDKNYPYAQSNLGDRVILIDERIGLSEEVRVVARSITRDWRGRILDLRFTFGTQALTKRYQAQMNNTTQTISDILDGRKKVPFQAMSNEIQIVTKLMQSVQTQFTIDENGSMIAVDKNNPNLLVVFNAAGLAVSDDGGQTFKNAITGRGILGDCIIANSITADKLDVNAITVGFNNSSSNMKLYSNRLEFFRDNILQAKLVERGMEFWYGTRKIGWMGEINRFDNSSIRGVSLNLETTGDFITFTRKMSVDDNFYLSFLTIDPVGKYTGLTGIITEAALHLQGNELTGVSKVKPVGTSTGKLQFGYKTIEGNGPYPIIGNENLSTGIVIAGSTLYLLENNRAYKISDFLT